ncbi:hypothetical protein [Nonomuraea sp. NPDC005650]|uniref:sodium:calcium antiporter n=1 Tax=Nonomuraea sp. NPDC005650 TaxID=3157045 RepID=UPI00339E9CC6
MFILVALSLAGLALLAVSADQLVLGSGRLAEQLGISPIIVGIVIIGFGTSAPELVVAGTAGAQGQAGLAVAGLVGSNVINLTLVLGVGGLTAALAVRSSILRREAPLSVAAVTVFAIALLYGLGPLPGLGLALALIGSFVLLVRFARAIPADPIAAETSGYLAEPLARHRLPAEAVRTVFGLGGTLAGAQLLVAGASELASRAGVSAEVIGFTLVALGTSLPELVTTVQAQRRGEGDLLIGNLLGSNLINSLAGGAIIAFTAPGAVITIPVVVVAAMVGVSLVTWALLARGKRLSRSEALLLLGLYACLIPLIT